MLARTLTGLAGAGVTAALAFGVPAVASADGGSSGSAHPGTVSTTTCPPGENRRAVLDFFLAHPDVAAVLHSLRILTPEEAAAAWEEYLSAHPDVAADVVELRADLLAGGWDGVGWGARSGGLSRLIDALAGHPELADLLNEVRDTPVGERRDVVRDYVADHPEVRAELHDLARAIRIHVHACRGAD